MNDYRVESDSAIVPLSEYLPRCVDVPRIGALCAACPHAGGRWCCPPFDFDPMSLWGRYGSLTLYVRRIFPRKGLGAAQALAAFKREKAALWDVLLKAEAAAPGSLALAPGSCEMCPDGCSRPAGVPCGNPQFMRYSIEALGGDVARTAELYLGGPLLWIAGEAVPRYLTLVGGVLTGGPV